MIPAGAAQTAGIAFTQCIAVATMPGLRARPASIETGCRPWNVRSTGGSPRDLDLEAFTLRPELPAGIEVTLAHQPVHRGRHHRDRRRRCRSRRSAARRRAPARSHRSVSRSGASRLRPRARRRGSGSSAKPSTSPTIRTDCRNPVPRNRAIGLAIAASGVAPNSMMSRIDVGGAVGPDVGELLGPHVRDRVGERRDHRAGTAR